MVENIVFPKPDPIWNRMKDNYVKALIRGDEKALKISRSQIGQMPIPKQYRKMDEVE